MFSALRTGATACDVGVRDGNHLPVRQAGAKTGARLTACILVRSLDRKSNSSESVGKTQRVDSMCAA